MAKNFKILVACEESQAVTIAFRGLGFEAYSCDLQECSGGHPEWHIVGDVAVIAYGCLFNTQNGDLHEFWNWDLMIGHPPCTYFSNAGLHYLAKHPERREKLKKSFEFLQKLWDAPIERICLENPVGWLNTNWKKPTQIIQPYYFGDPERKTTCLWLKNLPKLQGNLEVAANPKKFEPQPKAIYDCSDGKQYRAYFHNGKNAKERSKTFPGIAKAMAEQWGSYLTAQRAEERGANNFLKRDVA